MKLSPVSNYMPFGAKYGHASKKYETKEEIVKHFDNQKDAIELQKQKALEFEDFMQSDEVKAILDKLPAEDKVLSSPLLMTGYKINLPDMVQPSRIKLYYYTNSAENISKINRYNFKKNNFPYGLVNISVYTAQNKDRSIDKKGIVNWLKELTNIINSD